MTASIVRGDYVDPTAGKITLRSHAEAWQASHVGRPGTASLLDNALRLTSCRLSATAPWPACAAPTYRRW